MYCYSVQACETPFSFLWPGYALKVLTELLSQFIDVEAIKRVYKGRLVGTVLSGYLSLRKLVVQRTKLIDDTQDKFLELLEDMTSGGALEILLVYLHCASVLHFIFLHHFSTFTIRSVYFCYWISSKSSCHAQLLLVIPYVEHTAIAL